MTAVMAALVSLHGCAGSRLETTDLALAVYDYVDDIPGPIYYFPARADLNGDGLKEAIVHLAGSAVCGTGGCPTLVFSPAGDIYRLVADIGPGRPPVRLARTSSNGWRDIVVRVSGGGIQPGHDALLKFDGETYPSNPTVPPAQELQSAPASKVLIERFDRYDDGQLLKPAL